MAVHESDAEGGVDLVLEECLPDFLHEEPGHVGCLELHHRVHDVGDRVLKSDAW